jgi:hypothetical protein
MTPQAEYIHVDEQNLNEYKTEYHQARKQHHTNQSINEVPTVPQSAFASLLGSAVYQGKASKNVPNHYLKDGTVSLNHHFKSH